MDHKREEYETLINGKQFLFSINWDGFVWIGRALQFSPRVMGKVVKVTASDSAEHAAMRLVKLLENDK